MQHDPKKIPEFLKKIDEGYDMAIGTRYSQGGSIPERMADSKEDVFGFRQPCDKDDFAQIFNSRLDRRIQGIKKEVFLKEKPELTNFKGYTFQVVFPK